MLTISSWQIFRKLIISRAEKSELICRLLEPANHFSFICSACTRRLFFYIQCNERDLSVKGTLCMLNYWLLFATTSSVHSGGGKYLIWWFWAALCSIASFFFFHFHFFPCLLHFSSFSVFGSSTSVSLSLSSSLSIVCFVLAFFVFSFSVLCQVNLFTASEWACSGVVRSFICKTRKAPCNWKDAVDSLCSSIAQHIQHYIALYSI